MDQYIGKLLDNRYELLERIGTGGMAVVYKARCHRLNRLVAVKILKPELAEDAEFRRRFHDESQAVAMLSHPNIVSVYDVSRSDNLDYIVMELIDGITLKQFMKKRGTPLNWREALHFMIQIIKALGHAHSRGIIHRDIKPHNVMVLRDGSVKVADFGIARLTSSAQSTLTQEALGSVHYISPEQAKGSHIDGRSDIYSAGVVLYEMITGRLPYEGETPVSVAIQHINSIPIPPRELNPDVPEALEAITLKAMAPAPDQRYASADEMLADLEEFRKNPNISFEYTPADLHKYEDEGEPTQVVHTHIEGEESMRRRQDEDAVEPAQREVSSVQRSDSSVRRSGTSGRRNDPPARKGGASARRRREEEYDYDEEPRRFRFPVALVAVLVILLFIGGIVSFLWNSFFNPLFSPVDTYKVPDLRGKTTQEIFADTEITDTWGIILSDIYVTSDEYSYGEVAQQEPGPGTVVKENNLRITLYLSRGEDDGEIRMPALTGKELREAKDELARTGLNLVVSEVEGNSDSITRNYVISTEPLAGSVLEEGQAVVIVVSAGPAVIPVTVPYLENMLLEDAIEAIEKSKLTFAYSIPVSHDTIPEGYVVLQSIPARQEVEEGTPITLQVSTGPARPQVTGEPDPSVSPSAGPEPSPSAGPEPSPSVGPEPSPSVGPEPSPSVGPEPSPSVGPEPSPSVGPEPSPSVGPEPSPSVGPEPSPSVGPEPSPSVGPEPTQQVEPSAPPLDPNAGGEPGEG